MKLALADSLPRASWPVSWSRHRLRRPSAARTVLATAPAFMYPRWFDHRARRGAHRRSRRSPRTISDTPQMVGGVYIGTEYSSDDIDAFVYRVPLEMRLRRSGLSRRRETPRTSFSNPIPGLRRTHGLPERDADDGPGRDGHEPALGASVQQVPMPQNWTGYNSPGVKAPSYWSGAPRSSRRRERRPVVPGSGSRSPGDRLGRQPEHRQTRHAGTAATPGPATAAATAGRASTLPSTRGVINRDARRSR